MSKYRRVTDRQTLNRVASVVTWLCVQWCCGRWNAEVGH